MFDAADKYLLKPFGDLRTDKGIKSPDFLAGMAAVKAEILALGTK